MHLFIFAQVLIFKMKIDMAFGFVMLILVNENIDLLQNSYFFLTPGFSQHSLVIFVIKID